MLTLALIELYWEEHHGRSECTSKYIDGNYMVVYTINLDEFYDKRFLLYKDVAIESQNETLTKIDENKVEHIIRDFKNMFGNKKGVKLELVKLKELDGLEQVAIIETFWLKIFQKKIRKHLQVHN